MIDLCLRYKENTNYMQLQNLVYILSEINCSKLNKKQINFEEKKENIKKECTLNTMNDISISQIFTFLDKIRQSEIDHKY